MPPAPEPVLLDLGDFDAVGVAGQLVVALRSHAITVGVPATATVSPPTGWHTLRVTATRSGFVVLGLRAAELSVSRWNNVFRALADREAGWMPDDDNEGVNRHFPPGTEATTVAFEILVALTVAGAPTDVREVTAVDAVGNPVTLV